MEEKLSCKICKMGKSVLLVSVLHGEGGIKCWKCGKKWFDHYMLIDKIPYCCDCGEIMLEKLGFEEKEELN